jgi:hypothetical protein
MNFIAGTLILEKRICINTIKINLMSINRKLVRISLLLALCSASLLAFSIPHRLKAI